MLADRNNPIGRLELHNRNLLVRGLLDPVSGAYLYSQWGQQCKTVFVNEETSTYLPEVAPGAGNKPKKLDLKNAGQVSAALDVFSMERGQTCLMLNRWLEPAEAELIKKWMDQKIIYRVLQGPKRVFYQTLGASAGF
jgi:hypothetical protein